MSEPTKEQIERLKQFPSWLDTNRYCDLKRESTALRALLASWEERGREIERAQKQHEATCRTMQQEIDRQTTRADEAEARLAEVVKAVHAIRTFEPIEVCKDDFAYDRMVSSYREAADIALAAAQPKEVMRQDFNGEFLPAQPKEEPDVE